MSFFKNRFTKMLIEVNDENFAHKLMSEISLIKLDPPATFA